MTTGDSDLEHSSSDISLSVVIPAFNAERWIPDALHSVIGQLQPAPRYEILVVDDGSSDRTVQVAEGILQQSSCPNQVISLPRNLGVSHARNVGWRAAKGEWIQFLDADDLISPEKLGLHGRVVETCASTVAVVYSPWQRFTEEDGTWQLSGPIVESFVDNFPAAAILGDDRFGYVAPTLVRRSALEQISGFDEAMIVGEDFDLMLRLATSGYGFLKVPRDEPVWYYRDTPSSLWQRARSDAGAHAAEVAAVRRADLALRAQFGHRPPDPVRANLARRYLSLMRSIEDDSLLREMYGWLSDLDVRTVFPDSRSAFRVLVRIAGLGRALRLREVFRDGRDLMNRLRNQ